jgi:predicted DsbA family dithiol-disulfide isomerase
MNARIQRFLYVSLVVTMSVLALVLAAKRVVQFGDGRMAPYRRIVDWEQYGKEGHRTGPSSAKVTIVEFGDVYCVHCKSLESDIQTLLQDFPNQVALVYRHFVHSDASRRAAIALECAAEERASDAMRKAMFSRDVDLQREQWSAIATAAGVRNIALFRRCVESQAPVDRLRSDSMAALRLGVRGTPSLLVNSRFIEGRPGVDALRQAVRAELGHKTFFDLGGILARAVPHSLREIP